MIAKSKQKMKRCDRCGEIKEDYLFRQGQKYWYELCEKCEKTPSGEIPKLG